MSIRIFQARQTRQAHSVRTQKAATPAATCQPSYHAPATRHPTVAPRATQAATQAHRARPLPQSPSPGRIGRVTWLSHIAASHGLTLSALAEASGVPYITVCRISGLERSNRPVLQRLGLCMGLHPSELVEEYRRAYQERHGRDPIWQDGRTVRLDYQQRRQ